MGRRLSHIVKTKMADIQDVQLLSRSSDVYDLFIAVLKVLVLTAKGNLVTFRSLTISEAVREVLGRKDIAWRSFWGRAREFAEFLVDLKLVKQIKKTARGKIYGIERGSFFWFILERGNAACIAAVLKDVFYRTKHKNEKIDRRDVVTKLFECLDEYAEKPVVGTVGNQVQK